MHSSPQRDTVPALRDSLPWPQLHGLKIRSWLSSLEALEAVVEEFLILTGTKRTTVLLWIKAAALPLRVLGVGALLPEYEAVGHWAAQGCSPGER